MAMEYCGGLDQSTTSSGAGSIQGERQGWQVRRWRRQILAPSSLPGQQGNGLGGCLVEAEFTGKARFREHRRSSCQRGWVAVVRVGRSWGCERTVVILGSRGWRWW